MSLEGHPNAGQRPTREVPRPEITERSNPSRADTSLGCRSASERLHLIAYVAGENEEAVGGKSDIRGRR
jgi:hypothetical protein